jgi:dihydrofolate synthase/folylpolyglutamate synthase
VSFTSATAYLLGTINETVSRRVPNRLTRMRAFLEALGDPQEQYPTVHVGGTSGKGSTSTMIATALTASGKLTGLHTKPHFTSVTERARVDGMAISEDDFAELLGEMMPAIERVAFEHGRPSYYETLLALAFLWFARRRVDVAVIEVGVGGLLDGTNVLRRPQVSVITNVGLDHTDILGDNVESIASDKAGIAKAGVPLVCGAVQASVRAIIQEVCGENGAPFIDVHERARVTPLAGERYGQRFTVATADATYDLSLPVLGSFQQKNAAAAIVALEQLPPGLRPSVETVQDGFAQLMIPGRMEFFPSHPSVVFDIAHNPDKAQNLADALRETFPGRRFTFVVAITDAKDALGVLKPFVDLPAGFILTSFNTAGRTAARPQRLASMLESLGRWGRAIADPVEAFAIARRNADASDVVVVTGSTFVVATLRDWWIANVAKVDAQ